jgi:hypothetical protein
MSMSVSPPSGQRLTASERSSNELLMKACCKSMGKGRGRIGEVDAAGNGRVGMVLCGFMFCGGTIQLGEGGDCPASCLCWKGGRVVSGGMVTNSLLEDVESWGGGLGGGKRACSW